MGTVIYLCETNQGDMNITGSEKLEKFCKKHGDAQSAIEKWVDEVTKASWRNHNELKGNYLSADYVGNNRYVFNIRGNKYRLIVLVVFFAGNVDIRFVGIHSDYDSIGPAKIKVI